MHSSPIIRLRALEPDDANLMYVWENDPKTWEFSDRKWPVSLTDLQALIDHSDLDIWQTRQARFMIVDPAGETVGCIDIFDFDPMNRHCTVGIMVADGHRRRGYGSEALRQVEKMCFETFGTAAICATAEAGNTPSRRLFESAGYREVGVMRDWIRHGDHFSDIIIFQKTKNELPFG